MAEAQGLHDESAWSSGAGGPGGRAAGGSTVHKLRLQIMGEMSPEHRVERTVLSAVPDS